MSEEIDLDLMFSSYLDLPERARNSLRRGGIESLRDLIKKTGKELLVYPGIGRTLLASIEAELAKHGLKLGTITGADVGAGVEVGKSLAPDKDAYHKGWWNAAECFRERRTLTRREIFALVLAEAIIQHEGTHLTLPGDVVELTDRLLAELDKKEGIAGDPAKTGESRKEGVKCLL